MAIKKLLLAGAIVTSLAGAGLVWALVSTTSASYAEEAATDEDGGRPGHPGEGGREPGPGGPHPLSVAAEALGITEEELHDQLEAGESVASVAEAQGVDVRTVINALVADATARIQEHVEGGDLDPEEAAERTAELPERMADFVAREGLPSHGPRHRDC